MELGAGDDDGHGGWSRRERWARPFWWLQSMKGLTGKLLSINKVQGT